MGAINCDEPKEFVEYSKRIHDVNQDILYLVDTIESVDNDSIVILASDHGPFILNKCSTDNPLNTKEEVIERQEVFLAIKAGGQPFDKNIKSSVNLFRHIFAYLAEDPSILEDKEPDNAFSQVKDSIYQSIRDGKIIEGQKPQVK